MTRSFGLDAASALQALTDDARRLTDGELRDDLNVVLARDCAIKAWHLCEHAFQAESVVDRFPTLKVSSRPRQGSSVPTSCTCRMICNETKHARIVRIA